MCCATLSGMKTLHYKWLLRLTGLLVLVLIILKIDRNALAQVLKDARWSYVSASALLFGLHLAIKAVRWNGILSYCGIHVSHLNTLKASFTGALLGTVTPGRLGEFSKAAFIRSWNPKVSWGTSLGTILLDRVIDVFAFFIVALSGVVWIGLPGEYRIMGEMLVLLLLGVGCATSLFLWRILYRSSPGEMVRSFISKKIGPSAADFYRVFKMMKHREILPVTGWTVAAYVLFYLHFFLLARAMGSELSFGIIGWGIALASLGVILPISISGIGVRDFILIAIYSAWGEPPTRTLAISLTYLGILYTVIPLMGIWPLLRGELNFKTDIPDENPVN